MAGERDEFNLTSLQKRRFELFLQFKSVSVAAKKESISSGPVRSQVFRMVRKLFLMNLLPSFPYIKGSGDNQFFSSRLNEMCVIKKHIAEISAAFDILIGRNKPRDRTEYVFISKEELVKIIQDSVEIILNRFAK